MRKILGMIIPIALLLGACAGGEPLSRTGFMLDTVVTISLYDSRDPAILDDAFRLCGEYERIFSRHDPESEVARLNMAGGEAVAVSKDLREVIAAALYYAELTGGKYDITVAPVMDLWDFQSGGASPPASEAVEGALALVDWRSVVVEGETVRLAKGAQVDLGSIAKGYIADRLAEFLRSRGVESAIINLGGNVVTVGSKGGQPFRIGVQRPFEARNETVGAVEVIDGSVVSSGLYERYFRVGDAIYHHIIDPDTGWPSDTGLSAVTILSGRSVDGDALSTCCFLLGPEAGMELVEDMEGVEAILIDTSGGMRFSSGFDGKAAFRPAD